MIDPSRVLFVGLGQSAVGWYRCYLPAIFMGADWVGAIGDPPKLYFMTGIVKGTTRMADFADYDVIVLQQPRGTKWLSFIRELQSQGKKVVFEVDDYVHGIRKMLDHDFRKNFDRDNLRALEMCMRVCDGVFCSTEYIARRYRQFNPNVWVCENAVDMGRYRLTRPDRPYVKRAGVTQVPIHGGVSRGDDGRMRPAGRRVATAHVDDQDADRVLSAGPWTLHNAGYAHANIEGRTTYLHRFLLDPEPGMAVDHRNAVKLDCRRANLDVVTDLENRRRKALQPKEGRGAHPTKSKSGSWMAYLDVPGEGRLWLGNTHRSREEALQVVETKRKEVLGVLDAPAPIPRMFSVGWAGATGHAKAVSPWLNQVAWLMTERDQVNFVSVGMDFATAFNEHFPPERSLAVPFTMIDTYPAALTLFDVALAPAGDNTFFRGKSDLRFVEAGALGIPVIADPVVYPHIEHRVTGFHADSPVEMTELLLELVDNPKLGLEVGENARSYVRDHRDMRVAVGQWSAALEEVLEANG